MRLPPGNDRYLSARATKSYPAGGTVITFICQMCGMCCSTMGEIISIRDAMSEDRFTITYSTTLEERTVRLDPDKRDLFFSVPQVSSLACPFLRKNGKATRICTVHASRPDLCRNYSCFRILILTADGNRAGRVIHGTRCLEGTDPALTAFWKQVCEPITIPDEERWEQEIEAAMNNKGYLVIR